MIFLGMGTDVEKGFFRFIFRILCFNRISYFHGVASGIHGAGRPSFALVMIQLLCGNGTGTGGAAR